MQSIPNENDQVILFRQKSEKSKSTNINSLFFRFSPLIQKDSQHGSNGHPVFNNRPITKKIHANKIKRKNIKTPSERSQKIWTKEKPNR